MNHSPLPLSPAFPSSLEPLPPPPVCQCGPGDSLLTLSTRRMQSGDWKGVWLWEVCQCTSPESFYVDLSLIIIHHDAGWNKTFMRLFL